MFPKALSSEPDLTRKNGVTVHFPMDCGYAGHVSRFANANEIFAQKQAFENSVLCKAINSLGTSN